VARLVDEAWEAFSQVLHEGEALMRSEMDSRVQEAKKEQETVCRATFRAELQGRILPDALGAERQELMAENERVLNENLLKSAQLHEAEMATQRLDLTDQHAREIDKLLSVADTQRERLEEMLVAAETQHQQDLERFRAVDGRTPTGAFRLTVSRRCPNDSRPPETPSEA
jgi:hypothetical protein